MRPDDLFHPDHVIPSAEFISAFVKTPGQLVPQMSMKISAVRRQM
jgi:hypothetical protein